MPAVSSDVKADEMPVYGSNMCKEDGRLTCGRNQEKHYTERLTTKARIILELRKMSQFYFMVTSFRDPFLSCRSLACLLAFSGVQFVVSDRYRSTLTEGFRNPTGLSRFFASWLLGGILRPRAAQVIDQSPAIKWASAKVLGQTALVRLSNPFWRNTNNHERKRSHAGRYVKLSQQSAEQR
jgi:hypothetical protein